MKNSRKVIVMFIVLMMVVSMFAGCQNNESNNQNTQNENQNNEDVDNNNAQNTNENNNTDENVNNNNDNNNDNENDEPEETAKLLRWMIGDEPTDQKMVQEKINEYTREEYNLEIETRFSGWGEYADKLNTIIASGENFDICFTASWGLNFNQQVAKGAFADITDLLPEYGEGLLDLIPEDIWAVASKEGRIYGVPTYKDSATGNYYVFSKEYVDKYDLDISNVKNIEDLEPLLKTVKDAEPEINPLPLAGAEGLNGLFSGYEFMISPEIPLVVNNEEGSDKVEIIYELDDAMDRLRTLHSYYEAGYVNQDAATAETPPKFKFVFGAQGFPYADIEWSLGSGYDTTSVLRHTPYFTTASAQGSMSGISVNSENKEAAVKFLDAVNTDWTLRNMIAYGLEDVHYEKTGDTTIEILNQGYTPPLFAQATFFTLYTVDPAPVDKWEALQEYVDGAKPSAIMGFIFDPQPVETEIAVAKNVVNKYYSALHTGASDPDEVVPEMLDELKKVGLEDIKAELESQIETWKSNR